MNAATQGLFRGVFGHAPKAWWFVVGVVLATIPGRTFAMGCEIGTADGSASCYLTGTFEQREGSRTWLEIINPTGHDLLVYAYFFDANERPLRCVFTSMSANDLWEIAVDRLDLNADHGVAKLVSFAKPREPTIGIVGNQRIWYRKRQGISETGLRPIQSRILEEDLARMIEPNFKECRKVSQE